MLRAGMFIADRYEILEKIGSGGMSDVYKAKDHKLQRFVAVKVLKQEFSDDKSFVTKFRVEAQSAAGLMHANIVNVYDVGDEDGIYYIVMELVEGITLKRYIEKKGRLAVREAVSIAIQVAQGIEAAHNHHIVHRDIKPQNIIISKEGKVKVTDFGIARAASSNTINSNAMGSVHYISPEQARGGYSDEKSDIYSFGIMLFEMVTGRVPFEGDTTVSIALQHIQDDITSPSLLVYDIPISVEKIILKCTQKKTERRYQTMSDLILDLKKSLVTPNEDFVVMRPVASNGPTKMITEDELELIHKRTTIKADSEMTRDRNDDFEDEEDALDDDNYEYEDEEGDDDDDYVSRKGNNTTSSLDKVITALGITVAVIIVIITIFIVFKMVSVLSSDGNNPTGGNNNVITTEADDGKVLVPSVIGYQFSEGKEILNNAKLGIKPIYENSEYEAGTIIKQSIEADSRVAEHSTVVVTVSDGPEKFSMPNVLNRTEDEATTILENLGLKVEVEYQESSTVEQFCVMGSKPTYPSKVQKGDTVTIFVSMGDGKIHTVVPKLVGYTQEEAVKLIISNGFTVGTVKKESSNIYGSGVVIAQSGPTAGEKAAEGTAINLIVSSGNESVNNKYVYLSKSIFKEDIIDKGLIPKDAYFIRLSFSLTQGSVENNIAQREFMSYDSMVELFQNPLQVRESLTDYNKGTAQLNVYAYYKTNSEEKTVQLCSFSVTLTE